jgi:hypothetical protein
MIVEFHPPCMGQITDDCNILRVDPVFPFPIRITVFPSSSASRKKSFTSSGLEPGKLAGVKAAPRITFLLFDLVTGFCTSFSRVVKRSLF